MRLTLGLVALALALGACSGAPTDETPAGAARLFVTAMERSADDRRGLEDAYRLLSLATRERLVERARQTAALGAAEREPWEMMVEGRAHLHFVPRAGGFRDELDPSTPDRATVTVTGEHGEQASFPVVLEDGHWRVELEIAPGATE
jgi:hypothetical protein